MRYPSGKKFVKYLFDGHMDKDGKTVGAYTDDGCGLIDNVAHDIRSCIENEYDTVIKVVGQPGVGKSNAGIDIAVSVDPTFTLEERYVYDLLPFMEWLSEHWSTLKPGMCFLLDEATNLINNRDWQDKVNKYFIQFLEMFRSLGLILILILPTKERFDVYLRESNRSRYLIQVMDLKNGGKYEGRGFEEITMTDTSGKEIYVGIATFPVMDTSYIDNYNQLKKQSQKAKLDEMIAALKPKEKEEKGGRDKEMALWFILHEGWSYKEVSQRFGVPESTLRRWKTEFKREANE